MNEQLALQERLRSQFLQAQKKNPAFSLRAFARKVDLNPSAVSEILNGKRKVSRRLAEKVLARLGTDPKEQARILSLFPRMEPHTSAETGTSPAPSATSFDRSYLELKSDQFQLVSKWYHFAILSLAETKGFRGHPLWIAKRLGIKVLEAEQALERLERLGFIQWRRQKGQVRLMHAQLSSSDDIPNEAVRQSHHEDLLMASKALDEVPVNERDFTSLTIAIDKTKLPEAKKMIREFQDQLAAFLETGSQTEVYKLNFHVLPLSRPVSQEVK